MPATGPSARASRVWLALAVIYVVWGSTYLAIRWGLETIPPFAMASARYLAAGAILLAVAIAQGARGLSLRELAPAFVTGTAASSGPSSGSPRASRR